MKYKGYVLTSNFARVLRRAREATDTDSIYVLSVRRIMLILRRSEAYV